MALYNSWSCLIDNVDDASQIFCCKELCVRMRAMEDYHIIKLIR